MGFTGEAMKRIEDERLVQGRGRFTDDIHLPGMLEAHVVRNLHPHARIRSIDTAAARALPGVVAVWTYADLEGLQAPMPMIIPDARIGHAETPFVLAREYVRYVGEPVVLIVAESRYVAEDAEALVEVEYEPLPAVSALRDAVEPAAHRVHAEAAGNVAGADRVGFGDMEAALSAAHLVIRERFEISRGSAQPIETRAVVAQYDAGANGLKVWDSTQAPVQVRNGLAGIFGLPRENVRVIAGDVGGGFGPKMAFYAEELLVPYAARRLGRPVKWVEDRRESFVATTSEREQIHDVVVAVDGKGRLLGLTDHFFYETGAYIPYGLNIPFVTSMHLPGLYKVPAMQVTFEAIFTNRMFVSPYRGAGRPYAILVIERIMDRIAEVLGLDPAEVRRRNLIQPEEMPYRYPLTYWDGGPLEYDSGDYPALLAEALGRLDYEGARQEQARLRESGRLLGIGLACYSEATAIGPYEGARVQVNADGRITLCSGIGSQGQGHETTLAQVVADRLGVPPERIQVTVGDSAAFGWGIGTFASRGAVTAGNAAAVAAQRVALQARKWAAQVLEVDVADLELADGAVQVIGAPSRRISLEELALRSDPSRGRVVMDPEEFRPGLEASGFFNPPQATMAGGVHGCVVELDPETGMLQFHKYVAVHDCGRLLNPRIVEGQVLGGIAQGIGGAFYEELVFDDQGQLLTGSFMDYLLPTAVEVPPVIQSHHESPSPHNPLGVKGVGEAGTIPGHALIASAIEDALRPLGVRITKMPLSPNAVKSLIRAARSRKRQEMEG